MYRCVVLHRNGTSELQEVQPALHQKLRHLEYKRFVVEFVRDSDGISSTAPLYCQFAPSSWQASNAAANDCECFLFSHLPAGAFSCFFESFSESVPP